MKKLQDIMFRPLVRFVSPTNKYLVRRYIFVERFYQIITNRAIYDAPLKSPFFAKACMHKAHYQQVPGFEAAQPALFIRML